MMVRVAALKALASFLLAVEVKVERQPFQELVPGMLQTIADALTTNAEQECRDALEVRSVLPSRPLPRTRRAFPARAARVRRLRAPERTSVLGVEE